jgi:type II secretory pathway component PulF
MKSDELAFANQQLAGMIQSGLPLEGALRQLCETMQRGELKSELQALEADLARGTPLRDALAARRLPPFYVQMLLIGAQSNDLPAVLTLLADYYNRVHLAWTRLKGLLVYPLIVLVASFALSVLLATVYQRLLGECASSFNDITGNSPHMPRAFWLSVNLWGPATIIGLLLLLAMLAVSVPSWRQRLRWKFPAFRESSLSQMASALALMLDRGCNLNQALGMVRELEAGSPASEEIARWQTRLASGHKDFADLAEGGKVVPPLFVWLVSGGGEDWPGGFKQAAKVYYDRATQRVEMMLYAALPVSVLVLGLLILMQVLPMVRLFAGVMRALSNTDSFGD